MQTLDVISVNIWQILAALFNLLLMFLILKYFLYRPVQNMLDKRQSKIESDIAAAQEAKNAALADRDAYALKLQNAKQEAQGIVSAAVDTAAAREKELISEAKRKADGIVRQAEIAAEQERRKAEESIKEEIVVVSSLLTEKILEREVKRDDHQKLIDEFIRDFGEDDK